MVPLFERSCDELLDNFEEAALSEGSIDIWKCVFLIFLCIFPIHHLAVLISYNLVFRPGGGSGLETKLLILCQYNLSTHWLSLPPLTHTHTYTHTSFF